VKSKVDTKEPVTSYTKEKKQASSDTRWVRDVTEEEAELLTDEELLGLKLTAAKKCRGSLDDKMRCEERAKLAGLLKARIRKQHEINGATQQSCDEEVDEYEVQAVDLSAQVNSANEENESLARARDAAKQASDQWLKDIQEETRKTEKAEERITTCQKDMIEVVETQKRYKGQLDTIDLEKKDAFERKETMQEMHDKLQEYSNSLQGFNSKLQVCLKLVSFLIHCSGGC
jgi:chromosome segregation ATPase